MVPSLVSRLLSRPALWLLVLGTLVAYGVWALVQIPVEVLPQFSYPQVMVTAHLPGATPEEVETLVARPLEGELLGLQNLVTLRSVMGGGTLEVDLRFTGTSRAELDLQAVYGAIDRAMSQLPAGIKPYAEIMGNAVNEVADYCVRIPPGVEPVDVQQAIRTRILPTLRAVDGVQRVEVFGSGAPALWVQPDLGALYQHGVSLADVADTLEGLVVLGPAGYLRLGHRDVPLEVRSLPSATAELARVPVSGSGEKVPLGDLATIRRGAVPVHAAALLDGEPTVAVVVFKQPGASTIPVTDAVDRTLEELAGQLPAGASWQRIYSQGHIVRLIRDDLGRNLLVGGALAILVLFWILGMHRGVWVLALSIPLSLLVGIAGLHLAGQTLNLLTLGALSVAVGLLADDGIIVLESLFHRMERDGPGAGSVWRGLSDIAAPDVTGTLTTVSVYLPLLLVGGLAALLFVPFALAMSLSLLASLAISLTLIPLLLSTMRTAPGSREGSGARFLVWLRRRNERLLNLSLRHPRVALTASVVLLVASALLVATVSVDFLPLPNEGVLLDSFTLAPGTALTDVEGVVRDITRRLKADPAVAHAYARIGSAQETSYTEPSSAGELMVELAPTVSAADLDRVSAHLLDLARTEGVQQSVDTPTLERVGESLSGLPQPFVVRVYGNRIETLRTLSGEVVARLRQVPALTDIFNNDAYPVTQLRITPRTDALAVRDVTPAELYRQLELALQGRVVSSIPQGQSSVDLYVRLAGVPDLGVDGLRRLPVRTGVGWTPLDQLAGIELVVGPNQLRHLNGMRAVDILATPRAALGSTIAAARRALADLSPPAGYRVGFGGLYPTLEHLALKLGIALVGAFLLLVGILALHFEGLRVPGILLLDMPLALTGGALALAVSGVGLNATGLVGFLTVVGVSLNHDIVLLHRARQNEATGMAPEEAVREAVHVRFRPILLTTLVAVLGMLPTALGWGLGAEPEQGLAIVVLGGVVWSSLLSTNLIPALYLRWHGGEASGVKSEE